MLRHLSIYAGVWEAEELLKLLTVAYIGAYSLHCGWLAIPCYRQAGTPGGRVEDGTSGAGPWVCTNSGTN